MDDSVNHPKHYTGVVPGVECIEVTKHFSFLRGNAIKYLWRAGAKGDALEDLRKAIWYIQCEIDTIQSDKPQPPAGERRPGVGDRVLVIPGENGSRPYRCGQVGAVITSGYHVNTVRFPDGGKSNYIGELLQVLCQADKPHAFKEGDRVVIRAPGPQQGRLAVVCDVTGWSGKVLVRLLSGNATASPVRLVEPDGLGYIGSV